jgi:MFS family permease
VKWQPIHARAERGFAIRDSGVFDIVTCSSTQGFGMKRQITLLLALLGLVAFPQHAWANAGTALMWAGMLHLVIGNALIGLLEGVLLSRFFGVARGKAIGVMIVGNYTSAWLGGLFIRGAIVKALPMDLTNGWRWFWVMAVVTYFLTLIIEWPFIAWTLRGTHKWLRRSVGASFMVQSASYVLIFGWYWMASGTSLYTKMSIVVPADLSLPESVLVYFIAPADGDVYKRRLLGGGEQKIYELHSTDRNDRLFIRPSSPDTNR